MDPRLQEMARLSLIEGLVAYDRDQGWRGPVAKIDISGDWGVPLGGIDIPSDILPWRPSSIRPLESRCTRNS